MDGIKERPMSKIKSALTTCSECEGQRFILEGGKVVACDKCKGSGFVLIKGA